MMGKDLLSTKVSDIPTGFVYIANNYKYAFTNSELSGEEYFIVHSILPHVAQRYICTCVYRILLDKHADNGIVDDGKSFAFTFVASSLTLAMDDTIDRYHRLLLDWMDSVHTLIHVYCM